MFKDIKFSLPNINKVILQSSTKNLVAKLGLVQEQN